MRRLSVACAAICLLLTGISALAKPASGPHELGNVIKAFMLPTGARDYIPWAYGTNLPITWVTDGVAERQTPRGVLYYRTGLERIKVNGHIMWQLRNTKRELPWEITLSSHDRFGPKFVTFIPYHSDCFGQMNSGCEYDEQEALHRTGIRYQFLCKEQVVSAGNDETLYRIYAPGRKPAFLVAGHSLGSGGASTDVALYWNLPGKNKQAWCSWLKEDANPD